MQNRKEICLYYHGIVNKRFHFIVGVLFFIATQCPTISLSKYLDPCESSPWAGSKTPNLNGERRFLRGGSDDQALVIEDDSLQDHTHIDPGHTHTDAGHSHSYIDKYRCHEKDPNNYCDDDGNWGGSDSPDTHGDRFDGSHDAVTANGVSSIQSSPSNIAGVSETYRISSETKPRNMNVVWIMRVW